MLQSKVNYDKFYGHRKNKRTFKFRSMLRHSKVSGVIWGKVPTVAYLLGMDAASLFTQVDLKDTLSTNKR